MAPTTIDLRVRRTSRDWAAAAVRAETFRRGRAGLASHLPNGQPVAGSLPTAPTAALTTSRTADAQWGWRGAGWYGGWRGGWAGAGAGFAAGALIGGAIAASNYGYGGGYGGYAAFGYGYPAAGYGYGGYAPAVTYVPVPAYGYRPYYGGAVTYGGFGGGCGC